MSARIMRIKGSLILIKLRKRKHIFLTQFAAYLETTAARFQERCRRLLAYDIDKPFETGRLNFKNDND